MAWFDAAARDLPWRRDRDPYRVWISEVMLQQTRVTAVIPYFERFLQRFPTMKSLADAPEEDLLKAWAGLGYYGRARNLQRAAVQMSGLFPSTHEGIRALPGVGDYTAAAIASIAFELPHAAVDGNVVRVISRLENNDGDVAQEAEARLDRKRPGDFNQAMMELGATICLPRNPQCLLCPVADGCKSRVAGTQNELPVKRKSERFRVERVLLAIRRDGEMLFWQRSNSARKLAGFWEMPEPSQLPEVRIGKEVGRFQHTITNVHNFFTIAEAEIEVTPSGFSWISIDKPIDYLISTTARKALRILTKAEGV